MKNKYYIMILNAFSFLFFVSLINAQNNIINSDLQNSANVDTSWIRHYNSGQLSGNAAFNSMAVDNEGNIYCTGMIQNLLSGQDYLTVKYNAAGVEQWKAVYNGNSNSTDNANCITLDGQGNVYVSGNSIGNDGYSNYLTIKYNNLGEEQWVKRYDGPSSEGADYAYGIAADNSGNIYVTGGSDTDDGEDYATIKYNTDGIEQWIVRYPGINESKTSFAKFIALDEAGNVYVTGRNEHISSNYDYGTVKYNSEGTQLWVSHYDSRYNETDDPAGLVVDKAGNVYVTGTSSNAQYKQDFATVKYNTNGFEQWSVRYDGPSASNDFANDLVVDDSGYVYVTGSSYDSYSNDDFATIKYSPDGVEKWVTRYRSPEEYSDKATAITMDKSGHLYVSGNIDGPTLDASVVVKYDTSGSELSTINYSNVSRIEKLLVDKNDNLLLIGNDLHHAAIVKFNLESIDWAAIIEGPGLSFEHPKEMALDSNGNLYVAGTTESSETSRDFSLIKYDSSGTEQWVARYNGPDSSSDEASAMVIDSQGNIYLTGSSRRNSDGHSDQDFATLKYNSNGQLQWVTRFDGGINKDDSANDIALDKNGNIYVTGYGYQTSDCLEFVTVKYNASGAQKWVAYYSAPVSHWGIANAIAVDDAANVYVTGISTLSTSGGDIATIKYDTDGNKKWVARYNGSGNGEDEGSFIAVDAVGNIFVCGSSTGDGTGRDYTTLKYDSLGVERWVQIYSGNEYSPDEPTDMTIDNSGNVYVTGYTNNLLYNRDYYTIKYNNYGVKQWDSRYDADVYDFNNDQASSIALDADGAIYISGKSYGQDGNNDYVTQKLNSDGIQEWAVRYNYKYDTAVDVVADDKGHIYVTGVTNFNGDTHSRTTTIKYSDLSATGLLDQNHPLARSFKLEQNYPNPFNPNTTINYQLPENSDVNLSIYNILGQKVATLVNEKQIAGNYKFQWNASQFPSGLYFYRIKTKRQSLTKKMMLLR